MDINVKRRCIIAVFVRDMLYQEPVWPMWTNEDAVSRGMDHGTRCPSLPHLLPDISLPRTVWASGLSLSGEQVN